MWTVLKFEKKSFGLLKADLESRLGLSTSFYKPKILIQKKNKSKNVNKEINLLGDYIFCFNTNFANGKKIKELKYLRGLKYFLQGFEKSQNEITQFIKKCKENEDKMGFIKQDFLSDVINKKYKFISGPFVDQIFKIIDLGKHKKTILIGNIRTVINKDKDFFYQPI